MLSAHHAPDLHYTLRRKVLALPGERKRRSPEGGLSGHRSHSQEWQSKNGTQASLSRALASFPTMQSPASGLVPQSEEGRSTWPYLLVAAVGARSVEEKMRCR